MQTRQMPEDSKPADGCLTLVALIFIIPFIFYIKVEFDKWLKGDEPKIILRRLIPSPSPPEYTAPPPPQYIPVPQIQYVPIPVQTPTQPEQICNPYGCGVAPNPYGASPRGVCTAYGCP